MIAVFIELTTDAFANSFNAIRDAKEKARRAGIDRARRPLRGLEIKDDTYAIIKVVQADGTEIPLIDSGSSNGTNTQYANFILQSVQEARMEKHQIVETFGEPYIFFFGESPRFLDVTAVLVDSNDFNWYAEFWQNYNDYFRGTRLVEMGARCYLFYDDNIVEGYMLMAQARKVSEQPLMAQLTFRLYLTNYSNISFVGDPNFPVRASVNLPPGVDLTTADAFTAGALAVSAATQASLDEAASLQATLGAQQQGGGFGGAQNLSDALRSGVDSTGTPYTDGVLINALEALGNIGTRTAPLRGLISDNVDEFTALLPPPPTQPGSDNQDNGEDAEAADPWMAMTQQAGRHGASIGSPGIFGSLGISAHFSAQAGFGVGASASVGASFGVTGGSSFGAGYQGGINGGLGFTGTFVSTPSLVASAGAGVSSTGVFAGASGGVFAGAGASAGVGAFVPGGYSPGYRYGPGYASPYPPGSPGGGSFGGPGAGYGPGLGYGPPVYNANGYVVATGISASAGFVGSASASFGFGASASAQAGVQAGLSSLSSLALGAQFRGGIFGNGIQVGGGIFGGTGIGGGIPGGVSGGIGPNGPGTLTEFSGGTSFGNNFGNNASRGYGQGVAGFGAVLNVGGAPSAFATVSAPGTFGVAGTASETFNIGPGGVSSQSNTTGIFA